MPQSDSDVESESGEEDNLIRVIMKANMMMMIMRMMVNLMSQRN